MKFNVETTEPYLRPIIHWTTLIAENTKLEQYAKDSCGRIKLDFHELQIKKGKFVQEVFKCGKTSEDDPDYLYIFFL